MACYGEPLTGDPRAFARVKWSRLVNGDDVQCVFENAWDQPLLPTRHEELANPMYARSAQEWFNKLPDDTAKSIVNLRRSMLNVYKKQTTPLARPRAYQPLRTPADATAYDQALLGYPDPNALLLAQHQQQMFDQAQGEPPYPFYQAGQQLANILPWGKKQQPGAAQRPAAGVLPLSPDGSVGTGYPLYPLPPPGHPLLPPGGLAMPGVLGPDGKPLTILYGADGRPLPGQVGADGQPLQGVPIDDPNVPDEPEARRWYEAAGPFAGFDYQWQRIDAKMAQKQEQEAKQVLLEQQQQMLMQQQQGLMASQQQMLMGGLYPGGYPQGFRPPLLGQGPNGPYPMAPGMAGMGAFPGMGGYPGMGAYPGMAGLSPAASMGGLMPPPGMGAMGNVAPGMMGVPGGSLLTQTAAQMPPGALMAQSMAAQSVGQLGSPGMLRQSGAFPPGLGASMAFQPGMLAPPPGTPGAQMGYQLQQWHSALGGGGVMGLPPGAQGPGAPGALRASYTSRLPPQGHQYGQSMPGVGQPSAGQPQLQQQSQQQQQQQQQAALLQQAQVGRTGPPQAAAQFVGLEAQGQGRVGQGQQGQSQQGQGQQGQEAPPPLMRQGAIPRTGQEHDAAAAVGQEAASGLRASGAPAGLGGQAAGVGKGSLPPDGTRGVGTSVQAPSGLQRSGQIGRSGSEQDAAAAAGKVPSLPDAQAGSGAGAGAALKTGGTGAGSMVKVDGKDDDDYSAASRAAIKGQAAAAASTTAAPSKTGGLGKLPTLGGDSGADKTAAGKPAEKAAGAGATGGASTLKLDPKASGSAAGASSKAGGLVKPGTLPSTGDSKRYGLGAEDDDDEEPVFSSKASTTAAKVKTTTAPAPSTTTSAAKPTGLTVVKGSALTSSKPVGGLASKTSKGAEDKDDDYTLDDVDVEDEEL